MSGVNKVILIGHLGADPESRSMHNGGEVVNFRMATSESWKDRDGNRQERSEWHTIVIFNENLGKVAKNYLRKGSKVYVEGQLQTRKWTDQKGADHYSTEIVLQKFRGEICLLDAKPENSGSRSAPRQEDMGFEEDEPDTRDPDRRSDTGRGGGTPRTARPQPAAFNTDLDDDVPFISCNPELENRVL